MHILDHIKQDFSTFITHHFPHIPIPLSDLILNTDPHKQQFGDLSSNIALLLAKQLQRPTRDIAQEIVASFTHAHIARLEIAGPGFINFFLTEAAFVTCAQQLYTIGKDFFKKSFEEPTEKYSIEFVSANPTGPLHIGHGRNAIIGDVLSRVIRFRGHYVVAEFYINDAGSQIDKLGNSFKIRCQQQLGISAEIPEGGYQGEYLQELAQQCIEQYGNDVLHNPDTFFQSYAKEHLLTRIQQTLTSYGITFDSWFSESTLHASGAITTALNILTAQGCTYESEGALWFASTRFGDDKDRVLKKNTGELTYVAADVAYLLNKIERGFDHIIMVLGQDHHSYLTRLKSVIAALGYKPEMLDIILYQLVTLKESGEFIRMSKRAGRIVSLEDIIAAVGSDVARFFYLNRKADAHLDFDIDLAMTKTDENPVFYIQYAYVRTASILEKAATHEALGNINDTDLVHIGIEERVLLKKIVNLKDTLATINRTHQTHILAFYVHDLAHSFHSYYAVNRVIEITNIPKTRARLAIVHTLRSAIALCLDLLGVSNPEKM